MVSDAVRWKNINLIVICRGKFWICHIISCFVRLQRVFRNLNPRVFLKPSEQRIDVNVEQLNKIFSLGRHLHHMNRTVAGRFWQEIDSHYTRGKKKMDVDLCIFFRYKLEKRERLESDTVPIKYEARDEPGAIGFVGNLAMIFDKDNNITGNKPETDNNFFLGNLFRSSCYIEIIFVSITMPATYS